MLHRIAVLPVPSHIFQSASNESSTSSQIQTFFDRVLILAMISTVEFLTILSMTRDILVPGGYHLYSSFYAATRRHKLRCLLPFG